MEVGRAYKMIEDERQRAVASFPPHNSRHESWAVLREEMDELWDEIKADAPDERVVDEAVQVGTMVVRFLTEVCNVKTD